LRLVLVDSGSVGVGIATEGDVEVLQEFVATSEEGFRRIGTSVNGWLAIKDNDAVGEVRGHDEIVLDNKGSLLGVHDEALDDASSNDTLFGVEITVVEVSEVSK